jgi:hypothetical protein
MPGYWKTSRVRVTRLPRTGEPTPASLEMLTEFDQLMTPVSFRSDPLSDTHKDPLFRA